MNSERISVGQKMTDDIEDLAGVRSVFIRQIGVSYAVKVIMETTEFESFQRVVAIELELSDKYPALRFDFDIDFAQNPDSASVPLNAA